MNPNKKELEPPRMKFVDDGRFIYEEIYTTVRGKFGFENKYGFIKFDTETHDYRLVAEAEKEGVKILPIQGDEIEKEVIVLPDGIQEYESIEQLDEEIIAHINKWLDVDPLYVRLAAWSIRLSWVYDRFFTLNYLRALGDTGTGKSRYLNTIGRICYCPMVVSGATTPAPIFRLIDKWRGTLIIDEADQKESDETQDLAKIFNCGYERGMSVMRCDKNDPNKLDFFDVYCPKVIATRRRFDDKATEARCMTKIMTQTARKDIPDILTAEFYKETQQLQRKLLLFRLYNYRRIDPEKGLEVDMSEFEPRLRQVNRSFIGLFASDGKQIDNFKSYLREYQRQIIDERADTFEGLIIHAIAELVANQNKHITPQLIADKCNQEHIGKYEVTSRSVGRMVKTMGLTFKKMRVEDAGESKVLKIMTTEKETLDSLFSRYISDSELLEKCSVVPNVPLNSVTPSNGTKEEKTPSSQKPQVTSTNGTNGTMEQKQNNDVRAVGGVFQPKIEVAGTPAWQSDMLKNRVKTLFPIHQQISKAFGSLKEIHHDDLVVVIDEDLIEKARLEGYIMEVRPGIYQLAGRTGE